ncbi:hypothetical protein SADUNF_Sadunf05G0189300 [Salix dunnii]|uniref:Uncharacterized protein n=1 Tax=Salix dunnii TaxID=1413687 RepID=A0A835N3S7_9ROSI|nr:hypothetical protein SADUNF_Sadunf05G0189300 [Salix dunnii]
MAPPDFNALRDLHNSANDLLRSPEIQQVLVNQKQEKWLHEVSESSLRMLDVCGISKDVLLLIKEHLLDLHAIHITEKLKKETLKCLKSLKGKSVHSDISNVDHNIMVVVEVLREVRVAAITIVESLLSLTSIPCLDQGSTLHSANKRLETVEIAVEDLEAPFLAMHFASKSIIGGLTVVVKSVCGNEGLLLCSPRTPLALSLRDGWLTRWRNFVEDGGARWAVVGDEGMGGAVLERESSFER